MASDCCFQDQSVEPGNLVGTTSKPASASRALRASEVEIKGCNLRAITACNSINTWVLITISSSWANWRSQFLVNCPKVGVNKHWQVHLMTCSNPAQAAPTRAAVPITFSTLQRSRSWANNAAATTRRAQGLMLPAGQSTGPAKNTAKLAIRPTTTAVIALSGAPEANVASGGFHQRSAGKDEPEGRQEGEPHRQTCHQTSHMCLFIFLNLLLCNETELLVVEPFKLRGGTKVGTRF